jgi:hypothetical protein
MVNKPKIKGTAWETAIVDFLRADFPAVERRALTGTKDKGDVTGLGIPVVIEAKNEKTITLATYLAEVQAEIANAGADYGVAWVKRRGKTSPGDAYVLMDGWQWLRILKLIEGAK